MKKTIFIFCFLSLVLPPLFVSASTMPDIFPKGYWATGGLVSCTGGNCSLDELIQTVLNVVSFGITLALFVAAPILFGWGGIKIMLGSQLPGLEKGSTISEGKKILTGTLIGILIVLTAYLMIKTLVSLLGITNIGGF